jgi:hypothetical protein
MRLLLDGDRYNLLKTALGSKTFFDLRKLGIECFISAQESESGWMQEGFSGRIEGEKLYDYYSGKEIEIVIKANPQDNIQTDKFTVIPLSVYKDSITAGRNILNVNKTLKSLVGAIKEVKLFGITAADAVRLVNNLDIAEMPTIDENTSKELVKITDAQELKNILKISDIHPIAIFLNEPASDEVKAAYIQAVIERVLAANFIKKKTEGLKKGQSIVTDKDMEVLLGRMLKKKIALDPENQITASADTNMTISQIINEADKEKADVKAVNAVIDYINIAIIDNKKEKNPIFKNEDKMQGYRALLAAA